MGSIGAAKSQSKLSSSNLTHSQRSSSNSQTSVPISSHISHGGLTSTTVPGTHHSAQGNTQSTTAQPKSSRQSAPFSTGFSASHGNVNRSQGNSSSNDGNARSESGNRHGKNNLLDLKLRILSPKSPSTLLSFSDHYIFLQL